MEPVRICQSATHFKKIVDPKDSSNWLYEPCSPGEKEAEEMTLMDVPSDKLHTPDVNMKHFEMVLKKGKATVLCCCVAVSINRASLYRSLFCRSEKRIYNDLRIGRSNLVKKDKYNKLTFVHQFIERSDRIDSVSSNETITI
jgi:hypothetical protein